MTNVTSTEKKLDYRTCADSAGRMQGMERTLILGVGNILQKDDGIGVFVVNKLRDSGMQIPGHVDIMDGGTAGLDLIPIMYEYDRIIIIDALKVADHPGSVYRFTPEYLLSSSSRVSLHEIGISEILNMLKIQGANPEVEIIGIVPEDIETLEIAISPAVADAVPRVMDLILEAVGQNV